MDVHDAPAWLEQEDGATLPIAGSCSIGRAPGNQLVLADEKVSRKHALIHRQGDAEFWLVDLGSSNGSYLDGRRVSQPMAVRDGAVVRIGTTTLVFRQSTASRSAGGEPEPSEGTVHDIRVIPCWLLLADIEGSTELARNVSADQLPVVTGRWFSACKQAIETHGGSINKYLGDGFFAYWPARESARARVAEALVLLRTLQDAGSPRFRIVLHHGEVAMGGAASMGEESLSGPEVNFVFRMEKLAGVLRHARLISQAAHRELDGRLAASPAGEHPLSGFEGTFPFLTLQ